MNINENSNPEREAQSITMDLENLQQKYSNLLIQYKQAVADFINYLNTQSQQQYVNIKNFAYIFL
jgi:molecular chaperone GrpE (heat shock protein)